MWKCIRDMQRGRRGLQLSRIVTVNDENGVPCASPSEQRQRWRRHFNDMLNVSNQFDVAKLANVHKREVDDTSGRAPTTREVT